MENEVLECATEEVLKRIAGRDKNALRELHQMHGNKLYTELARLLSDRELARITYLELMPRVWREAAAYDPSMEDGLDWLLRRARCLAIERLKEKAGDQPFYGRNIAWEEDADLDQTERQLRHHQVGRINTALRTLSVQAAEMLVARLIYGLSLDDLGSLYNLPSQVVGRRVRSAGVALRTQLLGAAC